MSTSGRHDWEKEAFELTMESIRIGRKWACLSKKDRVRIERTIVATWLNSCKPADIGEPECPLE